MVQTKQFQMMSEQVQARCLDDEFWQTSIHCPSLRKRRHYQLSKLNLEYSQYENSFFNRCLFNFRFDDYNMTVMMICSRDHNSPSVD